MIYLNIIIYMYSCDVDNLNPSQIQYEITKYQSIQDSKPSEIHIDLNEKNKQGILN